MSSILRSSKFSRYIIGFTRNIVISNRQDAEGNLLQKSRHLSGLFSSISSTASNFRQGGSSLEQTIRRLDQDARQTGRISMKEVEEALNEIRNLKNVTTSQSLMVIRCCGNLVPEEAPEHRTKLVEEIWNTLEKLGVPLDISHYNALLKVYLENEHKFSPTEFLAKLKENGIEPNRVTYQRLIAGYCQSGDIAGATKILEYMKEKQLPVNEGVFNALILGHSLADDIESAESMLVVMRQASLEPSSETYTTLLCGYARKGDKTAMDQLITECKVKDVLISDRDFLEVVYTAATSGHEELVDEILKNVRYMLGYNQDASNTLLRLMTKGKDEAAYKVFKTLQSPQRIDQTPNMSGHVIIKQLVKTNRPVEQIQTLCERLETEGHTKYGLWLAVETSFHYGNVDLTLDLLRVLKQKGEPVRSHYFWPSLATTGKTGNVDRVIDIVQLMTKEFNIPLTFDTLKDYILPFMKKLKPEQIMKLLVEAGARPGQVASALIINLISQNKLKEAVDITLVNPRLNLKNNLMTRLLVETLNQGGDVGHVVTLVHVLATGISAEIEGEEDEEPALSEEVPGRFLLSVAKSAPDRITTVLREMVQHGLSVSNSCAEQVESRLSGKSLTTEVSELLSKLSSGELNLTELKKTAPSTDLYKDAANLERIIKKMKTNNVPQEKLLGLTRNLFQAYCNEGDLENALKIKQEWVDELKQELTTGWWANLLELYCVKEDLEGVKSCLENISKSIEFELDVDKVLKAAKLYIKMNQLDEAIELIRKIKPRQDNKRKFSQRAAAWQALQAVAESTKDPDQVKRLLTTLVEQNYIEINNVYLGPVIKAYMLRDDLDGALKEFEHCVVTYRATPWKNEITSRLIEKEDAERLQVLVNLSTQVHGEINSLYDLVLCFVECNKIRQARKILETPGLKSRSDRIHMACIRYKDEGLAAPLEGLVEATKDMTHIDRSEIYYNLLETYCTADNVDKAYGLWTQMQDEDVHVSDQFLIKLGTFLKSKGLHVPFEIPKAVAAKKADEPKQTKVKEPSQLSSFRAAIRASNVEEALKIQEQLQSSDIKLNGRDLSSLMDLLVKNARYKEAISLLDFYPEGKSASVRTLNFLTSKLIQTGRLDLMDRLGDHLSVDMKKLISYINKHLNCALVAGKAQEELDKLEKQIETASTSEEVDSAVNMFPIGGIYAVLENSSSYQSQIERIVEKYYGKGSTLPANCLCMYHLSAGQIQQAQEVFRRYNLANSSRLMFQVVLNKARTSANPVLLEELLSLLKGVACITPELKGIICSNLLNVYINSDNVDTALAKLDELVKIVPIEHLYTSTLTNLKEKATAINLPFKYTIPPKKVNESSSSSSSSDVEPQKSMAAKH